MSRSTQLVVGILGLCALAPLVLWPASWRSLDDGRSFPAVRDSANQTEPSMGTSSHDDSESTQRNLHRGPLEERLTTARAALAIRGSASDCAGALRVLAQLGADAVPEIAPHLSASDPRVRRAAVAALGETGSPSAVPVLVQRLSSSPDVGERLLIVSSLAQIPATESLAALQGVARSDSDPLVRRQAARAADIVDRQPGSRHTVSADANTRGNRPNSAEDPLSVALDENRPRADRLTALHAIAFEDPEGNRPIVEHFLSDPDPVVSAKAKALLEMKRP